MSAECTGHISGVLIKFVLEYGNCHFAGVAAQAHFAVVVAVGCQHAHVDHHEDEGQALEPPALNCGMARTRSSTLLLTEMEASLKLEFGLENSLRGATAALDNAASCRRPEASHSSETFWRHPLRCGVSAVSRKGACSWEKCSVAPWCTNRHAAHS